MPHVPTPARTSGRRRLVAVLSAFLVVLTTLALGASPAAASNSDSRLPSSCAMRCVSHSPAMFFSTR